VRTDDLRDVLAVSPAAIGIVATAWTVLLALRLKLWFRMVAWLTLLAFSAALEASGGAHWMGWGIALAISTWLPASVWARQAQSDKAFRAEHGLPQLGAGELPSTFSADSWSLPGYRWRMTKSPESWNRLWDEATYGRRWPAFLRTQRATPSPITLDSSLREASILELLRHHGVRGPVYETRRDHEVALLIDSEDYRGPAWADEVADELFALLDGPVIIADAARWKGSHPRTELQDAPTGD
jgi:hypothetical protein